MYTLVITKTFKKALKKIDPQYHKSIRDTLDDLKIDPYKHADKVKNPNLSDWKTRDGEYRILFNIVKKEKSLQIITVRHRREVYQVK